MKNQLARMVDQRWRRAARCSTARARSIDRNRSILRAALDREQELRQAERAELRGDLRAQRRARSGCSRRSRSTSRPRAADEITRAAIQVHGGLGFMAESVPRQAPRRRDHHHDLRGHVADPGLVRAEGGRQGRARRRVRRGARDLASLTRPELAPYADRVRKGIDLVLAAGGALAADLGYALLSAQSLAENLASILVAGELLRRRTTTRSRFDIAASWVERRMVDLEGAPSGSGAARRT